jgi:hypothetical protein
MHDLFGGALYAANRTGLGRSILNNIFGDAMRSPGVSMAMNNRIGAVGSKAFGQQVLTNANINMSKEFLSTKAMQNTKNWMIGGAAYGGITGANNGRRNGQGALRGGIGGALRGGAMGFGGARGYAMFGHKIPNGFKDTVGSFKPFGRQ